MSEGIIVDDIEVELTGTVTIICLTQAVRRALSNKWELDLAKFQEEMKDRITLINGNSKHRLFKLPVIYKGEI